MDHRSSNPKRAGGFQNGNDSAKRARLDEDGGVGGGPRKGMTAAQRMMAKMGYQKGQGLGKDSSGIVNPLEAHLRPQGVGVGAVKEQHDAPKPRQSREQQTQRSSESPKPQAGRHIPKQRQQKSRYELSTETWSGDSSSDDEITNSRAKQTEIIDQTGGYRPVNWVKGDLSASQKAANYARRELDAFTQAADELKLRWKESGSQIEAVRVQIDHQEKALSEFRKMTETLSKLQLQTNFSDLVSALESLQTRYADDEHEISDLAVAAIYPHFKDAMSNWDPLESPSIMPSYLERIKLLLGIQRQGDEEELEDGLDGVSSRRTASLYESIIYSLWIPKIRTAVVSSWDVFDPAPMLETITTWRGVLPQLAYDVAVNQLIAQKLSDALRSWKPDATHKKQKGAAEPHKWLFPWLQYLDEYHLDPKSSSGLLAEVKRKFRTMFSTWNPNKGIISGFDTWLNLKPLQRELRYAMDLNLLSTLARYLHDNLDIDPSNQDPKPMENIMQWQPYFSPEKFSRLLLDAFFPKWLNVLHLWLTSEPNYEEIGQWFQWWQSQLPEEINAVPAIAAEWDKGLAMMNQALDIGPERVKSELAKPQMGPARPIVEPTNKMRKSLSGANKKQDSMDTTTFKDVVEDLCAEQSLLMIPLRKAHSETGLPLYRITASAAGTGGMVVYLKGDVAWAQGKDKSSWEPVDVFDENTLLSAAEKK